mmetsp:Transcript_103361/g.331442  ORF Transcript_103361/g.331442 Transcript_103361/m.331442 type:complete len:280 (-) Transcript_103361:475-1314(-)
MVPTCERPLVEVADLVARCDPLDGLLAAQRGVVRLEPPRLGGQGRGPAAGVGGSHGAVVVAASLGGLLKASDDVAEVLHELPQALPLVLVDAERAPDDVVNGLWAGDAVGSTIRHGHLILHAVEGYGAFAVRRRRYGLQLDVRRVDVTVRVPDAPKDRGDLGAPLSEGPGVRAAGPEFPDGHADGPSIGLVAQLRQRDRLRRTPPDGLRLLLDDLRGALRQDESQAHVRDLDFDDRFVLLVQMEEKAITAGQVTMHDSERFQKYHSSGDLECCVKPMGR